MKRATTIVLSLVALSAAASAAASSAWAGGTRVRAPAWSNRTKKIDGDRVIREQSRTWTLPQSTTQVNVFGHVGQATRGQMLRLALVHLEQTPLPGPIRARAKRIVFAAAASTEAPAPTADSQVLDIDSPHGVLRIRSNGVIEMWETRKGDVKVHRRLSNGEETEMRDAPLHSSEMRKLDRLLGDGETAQAAPPP